MKKAGQVVLFRFPQADRDTGKLRPALLLSQLPRQHGDWLMCMISSQTGHYVLGFDDMMAENDADFAASGLKTTSVIRVGRLAVVLGEILMGAIGEISTERLKRIKQALCQWLAEP